MDTRINLIYLTNYFTSVLGVAGLFLWSSVLIDRPIYIPYLEILLFGTINWFVFTDKIVQLIHREKLGGSIKKVLYRFYLYFSLPNLLSGISVIYVVDVLLGADLDRIELILSGAFMGGFILFSNAKLFLKLLGGLRKADGD